MIPTIKVADEVLLFGRYHGTVHTINDTQLLVYCPEFCEAEPWIVIDVTNVILLESHEDGKLLN